MTSVLRARRVRGGAVALLLVTASVAGALGRGATQQADAATQPPNVVLILLDDARLDDLSVMPDVKRRIGDQGATLSRFYSSFPLCCPARATLLTGEYPHNHGVLSNHQPTGGFAGFDDSSTLATWLDGTYRTGLVGKYFNEYAPPYTPPGWDEWMVPKGMYNYAATGWWIDKGLGGRYTSIPGYQTDTMGALASDFITRNAGGSEPFFLYTSLVAPHAGSPADPDDIAGFPTPYVKPTYRDRQAGATLRDPSVNEADVSDKPIQPTPLTSAELTGLQETNAQRHEAMLSAQDATNQILDALESSGAMANTYVLFMSDNGYILGEHRIRGGKLAPYEVSNHVPLMVRGPGITPGSTLSDVTAQVDFAPTVMAMAGQPAPASVDGVNLLPLMTSGGSVRPSRQGVLIEATDTKSTAVPLPWLYRGVVSQGFKYVERTNGKRELYDLTADPSELTNQAGSTAYAETQKRLAGLLTTYRACRGDVCR